jgi:aryl sulfotransferase
MGYPMPPPNPDIRAYFLEWLECDGYPFWPFWAHARTWWQAHGLPNVLPVHYAHLKTDLPGQIRRIAAFLDIAIDEAAWPRIVEHCSFDYMKQHATKSLPFEGKFWDDGARTFVNKGVNGRWRDVLTADDIARYDAAAERELGAACARWFARGERT